MAYRSNSFNVSPWQQRGQSFPMGSYGQSYNSYGGYAWNDSYSMNQMGRMAYDTPFRYGSERSGRNQLSPRRKPMHGKRLPQRSPASGPPSKRPNFGGEKSKRRNEQRKRFSRAKKNFRRPVREETASDYEDYEMLKGPDDEVEKEKEENAQKEETMEVNGIGEKKENEGEEKKEEGKKDATEKKETKPKFYACHICKVVAMRQDLIDQHGTTEEHKAKIDAAVAQYREKKPSDSEKEKTQKQKARSDNWCTVCEMAFSGHFLSHRSTSEHRRIRDKKYPKCRPCSAGFSSAEEYRDHVKSESHKVKSAEFYHFKKLPLGFDNDDEALEPVKIEEEEAKDDETKVKEEPKEEAMETDSAEDKKEDGDKTDDKEKEADEKKDKKESDKKEEKKQSKKPNPLGVSFVVEVDGFYCKLCRKFFKDGSVAKKKHCYSVMHYEAYKQVMEVALKDEEERQRVAEAHAKAEAEAQEAAKLAADIAAIQREARAAARKAASEKRAAKAAAEQPKEEKDEGIEMSPTDDQEKPTEVKQEAKDESSLPEKKEQTEEMCT